MKKSIFLFAFIVFAMLPAGASFAGGLSREPPSLFTEKLAPLLTPLKEVLDKEAAKADSPDRDGAILLNEELRWLDDDGKIFTVVHSIMRAYTEAGAQNLSPVYQSFRKDEEQIHLAVARTIQPDGSFLDVKDDAAFVQTPQYWAKYNLYTDVAELVVVFPNVKAGSTVEYIVVTEEPEFRIPGEFTACLLFDAYWPSNRSRHVVELPPKLAARLKTTTLGAAPEAAAQTLENGRVRYSWVKDDLKALAYESDRAPLGQVGPAVWLTTLKGWSGVAGWYRGLLAGRDEITPELKALIDEWTEGIEGPKALAAALQKKAANLIRYVGLNFGLAGFRPHSAGEVWENQYGDCKDKANLLRAMLKYKGIKSHMALLDTDHAGRIEKESPDFRHFDHVILAVEVDGGYHFCDPTISYLEAGSLGPSDADREVFVVKDEGFEFVRTPEQKESSIAVDFDFNFGADGSLEGWMSMEANEYLGALYAKYFNGMEKGELRDAFLDYSKRFFEGVELVDFQYERKESNQFAAKAYLFMPGAKTESSKTLTFPHGGLLFPDLGDEKIRETSYFQTMARSTLKIKYNLPDGWTVGGEVPHPFELQNVAASSSAHWEVSSEAVAASAVYTVNRALLTPGEYVHLVNGASSFEAWMGTRVLVGLKDSGAVKTFKPAFKLIDFPKMPSGAGQLELLEKKYPSDGNIELRRAALERVIQWFPNDGAAAFEAGVKLASLKRTEGSFQEAVNGIRALLSSGEKSVDAESHAWAEYMLALCLGDLERFSEAKEVLLRIARDATVSGYRRGWSYYEAARMAGEESSAEAALILEEGVEVDSEALADEFSLLSYFLLLDSDLPPEPDRLKARLAALVRDKPQFSGSVMDRLLKDVHWRLDRYDLEKASLLFSFIETSVKEVDAWENFWPDMIEVEKRLEEAKVRDEIMDALLAQVEKDPPQWFAETPLEAYEDEAELLKIIEAKRQSGQVAGYLRHYIELVAAFVPSVETFGPRLRQLTVVVEAYHPDSPLFSTLLELLEKLPSPNGYFHEIKFMKARVFFRAGKNEEAADLYRQVIDDPDASPELKVTAHLMVAELEVKRGKNLEALKSYKLTEEDRKKNIWAYNGFLRAVFINLSLGNRDEALRLIGFMGELQEGDLAQLVSPIQIKSLAGLAEDPYRALTFWSYQEKWRPKWLELENKMHLANEENLRIPIVPNVNALGVNIGQAIRAGDREGFVEILRTAAECARWQPEMVAEFTAALMYVPSFFPELVYETRAFAVAMNESVVFVDPFLKQKKQVQLAANYFDHGQPDKALDLAMAYLEEFTEESALRRAMTRLLGLAAVGTGRELAFAAETIEAGLTSGETIPERAMVVGILGDVYMKLEKPEAAINLLARELEHPDVKGSAHFETLIKRRDELVRGGNDSKKLSAAVRSWLEANKPAWFDFAEPKSLDDPRGFDLEKILEGKGKDFSPFERFKIGVLAAMDESRPVETRARAFIAAAENMGRLIPWHDETIAFYDSILKVEDFGARIRSSALWKASLHAVELEDWEKLTAYKNHPLFGKLPEGMKKMIGDQERQAALLKTDSATELKEVAETLMAAPIDYYASSTLHKILIRLIGLGEADAAQSIYEKMGSVRVHQSLGQSASAFRMSAFKTIKEGTRYHASFDALRKVIFPRINAEQIIKPEFWSNVRDDKALDSLAPSAANAYRLYKLKSRDLPKEGFFFWREIADIFLGRDDRGQISLELARAAVLEAADDEQRATAILAAPLWVDLDVEEEWGAFVELLAPYRDQKSHPLSYQAARFCDVWKMLRTGAAMDVEAILSSLDHPMVRQRALNLTLAYYIDKGNLPLLASVLRRMSPEELTSPSIAEEVLRALEMVGMNDEAVVVREAAEEHLSRAIIDSWTTPFWPYIHNVFRLANALDRGAIYPKEWLDNCLEKIKDKEINHMIRMLDARLKGNWTETLENADAVLAVRPTFYDAYNYKGLAEHHLGKTEQALASLRKFTEKCHDNIDNPKALEVIAEIEKSLQSETRSASSPVSEIPAKK